MLDPPVLSAAPEPQPANRPATSTSATVRGAIRPMLRRRSRRVIRVGHSSNRGWSVEQSSGGNSPCLRIVVTTGASAAARGVVWRPQCSLSAPPAGRNWQADYLCRAVDDGVRLRPDSRPCTARSGVRRAPRRDNRDGRKARARRRSCLVRTGLGGLAAAARPSFGASAQRSCHSGIPPALLIASAIRSRPPLRLAVRRRRHGRPRRGGRACARPRPSTRSVSPARLHSPARLSSTPSQALRGCSIMSGSRRR